MIENLKVILPTGKTLKYNFDYSAEGTLMFVRMSEDVIKKINLNYHKCSFCTLEGGEYAICPAAEIISYYTNILSHIKSYEMIEIEYTINSAPTNLIKGQISAQMLAVEFMKIATFQSKCPIGRKIKTSVMKLPEFLGDEELLGKLENLFNEDNKYLLELYIKVFENLMERFRDETETDSKMNGFVHFHTLMRMLADEFGFDLD